MRAAGIGGYVAADGTGGLARRIRGVKQALCLHRVGYPGINASRLDERAAIPVIRRQDFVHPCQSDHNTAGDGQYPAAQAGARAAGDERNIAPGAKFDHGHDLLSRAREHHGLGQIFFQSICVALINEQLFRAGDDGVAPDDGAQIDQEISSGIGRRRWWHEPKVSKRRSTVE